MTSSPISCLCRTALCAIREYLDDPETEWGDWLTDKILEVELRPRPDAAELRPPGTADLSGLSEISDSWAPRSQIRSRWEKRRSSDGLLSDRCFTPVLACLLSPQASSSACSSAARPYAATLWPSTGETEVLLASVTPKFGTLRGAEHSLLVEVASVRPGFATIITLAPDRPQQVFPEPGEEPDPRRSIGTANLRPPAPRLDHRAGADHRDTRD